jgi:acyl phosphate:glycerol-3-phosphate acyltransferase
VRRALPYVVLGYLIGAVPLPFIAGRLFGRVDLRESGTRVIGASNLRGTAAGWAVAPVGVTQILQGALPPYLAKRRGEGPLVQVASGIASVLGQDWNVFLGLRGGRGMAHSIGFLLALSPASFLGFAVCGIAGRLANQVPLSMLIGLLLAPFLSAREGRPASVVLGCGLVAGLAAVKRLLGNGPAPAGETKSSVYLWRLLFDRDVLDRDAWLAQGPARGS